eukprot:TRINITY_DN10965_c0_g1_i3.p1 TRINITY_DN10965_c0_g1~~TRINITY_DN10965_c0_g1_i3.p1  ORF type:complete len:276 (+),score=19.05 TRINITY_DN10965_c0_g1_i3:64-891(+)
MCIRDRCVSSTDEYFEVNGKMLLTETTLSILDQTIYNIATTVSLKMIDSMRVMAANRLAKDPKDWISWFSKGYTGRYSSQWMIINVEKARKSVGKEELEPGTFYVYEQIPTSSTFKDTSLYLNHYGYWSSYNVPFFPKILRQAGYDCSELDDWRESRKVQIGEIEDQINGVEDMMKAILHNVPKNKGGKPDQIAPRFDQYGQGDIKFGAIDGKVANLDMMERGECQAIGGPTHQDNPPFKWGPHDDIKHFGMPEVWDFNWVYVSKESLEKGFDTG